MTSERLWTPEALESIFDAQGLRLAPERAARIAAGLNASARVTDPLLGALELETDPMTYALALRRCASK